MQYDNRLNAEPESTEFVTKLTQDKFDPEMGAKVREHLHGLGLETGNPSRYDPETAYSVLEGAIHSAFPLLGMLSDDPSTKDTPKRFAAMFVGELTKGLNYDFFPKCTVQPNGHGQPAIDHFEAQIKGGYNQMVRVKSIQIISLCEHHLQTIDGWAHIAYIPSTKVLGLSKFARVADFFARRPQIQERMTEQIYEALKFILETDDIAIVIDAKHYCMHARGAMQANASTQTNKMGGRFMTNGDLRKEFFDGIG